MRKIYQSDWLGLMIGNSRLHWAYFPEGSFKQAWDTEHIVSTNLKGQLPPEVIPKELTEELTAIPLYIASVVPEMTKIWESYPHANRINLEQIPLKDLYPTLGIDRALAVYGAGKTYGFPCLVIDAGTGFTFTGVDSQKQLQGGAILPGFKLQINSLATNTAALPEIQIQQQLPLRWAKNTQDAIASGIIYSLLAAIKDFSQDWLREFKDSPIVITGGDSALLRDYLEIVCPEIASKVTLDEYLIFWGMRAIVEICTQ